MRRAEAARVSPPPRCSRARHPLPSRSCSPSPCPAVAVVCAAADRARERDGRVGSEQRPSAQAAASARGAARRRHDELPAPVQLPAVARPGGRLSLGGLDAGDASVAGASLIAGSGAHAPRALPLALHDAAAAQRRRADATCSAAATPAARAPRSSRRRPPAARRSAICPSAPPTSRPRRSGTRPTSSAATPARRRCARSSPSRPGAGARRRRRCRARCATPRSPRSAAALLIAGGTSGVTPQRAILCFDPASGRVRQIGGCPIRSRTPPAPSLSGRFYVLGGRGEASPQRRRSSRSTRASGAVRPRGRLPVALSDLGAASLAGRILARRRARPAGGVHDER